MHVFHEKQYSFIPNPCSSARLKLFKFPKGLESVSGGLTWVDYDGTWVREKMISFAHNNFVMIQPLKSENSELAAN